MSDTLTNGGQAADAQLADDDFVTVAWLKGNGFRYRHLGPRGRELSYFLPGSSATQFNAVLCVSTHEMERRFHPYMTCRSGRQFLYCFPRKLVTVGEMKRLIKALSGTTE